MSELRFAGLNDFQDDGMVVIGKIGVYVIQTFNICNITDSVDDRVEGDGGFSSEQNFLLVPIASSG